MKENQYTFDSFFEEENKLDTYIGRMNDVYRNMSFLWPRMDYYLNSGKKKGTTDVWGLRESLEIGMKIIKCSCKSLVKETYYSFEKRAEYDALIDGKMRPINREYHVCEALNSTDTLLMAKFHNMKKLYEPLLKSLQNSFSSQASYIELLIQLWNDYNKEY
jgi:hypothetical protein